MNYAQISRLTLLERLAQIRFTIEEIERRCMAADGPVTPTKDAITDKEIRRIWRLAQVPKGKTAR